MDPMIKNSFFTILIYWNDNRIHLGLTKKLIFFILFPPLRRGGNKIWIFKPQVNFDVIPTYKHGGKWFFEFGGHLNPPHLRWSFLFFGDFQPFRRLLYIFILAGLEPKPFEFKSSTQQQSCKAHKIGQFCHQDQPSICLCSRVTDRATTAFHLAPKW